MAGLTKFERNSRKAIDWWIDKIKEADSEGTISTKQYQLFKEKALSFIFETEKKLQCAVLWTINSPSGQRNIVDIAEECNIKRDFLPAVTSMIITRYRVSVSEGLKSPHKRIA